MNFLADVFGLHTLRAMPSKVERVASLDLVRGTAAFTVAISHHFVLNSTDWPAAQAVSELAVEVFFVLSGFVLAPQILFCSRDGRIVNLWVFLTRRWMRTIPPFLVALVAISLLTDQLMTGDFFRYVFYVQNVFAQHNVQDYFAVAWSLSTEVLYICGCSIYLHHYCASHDLWGDAELG